MKPMADMNQVLNGSKETLRKVDFSFSRTIFSKQISGLISKSRKCSQDEETTRAKRIRNGALFSQKKSLFIPRYLEIRNKTFRLCPEKFITRFIKFNKRAIADLFQLSPFQNIPEQNPHRTAVRNDADSFAPRTRHNFIERDYDPFTEIFV